MKDTVPSGNSYMNVTEKVASLVECLKRTDMPFSYRNGGGELSAANAAMKSAAQAEHQIQELSKRVRELELLVRTDELTNILNRRGFVKELQRAISASNRYSEVGVLIYIDLDDFKPINDTYGHAAGDEVLRQVARILKESIRETDYIGRLGGDEFAILLTHTSWDNALDRAERIERQLNYARVNWQGHMLSINASFGIQSYGPGDNTDALLRSADEAMYENKNARTRQDSPDTVEHRAVT